MTNAAQGDEGRNDAVERNRLQDAADEFAVDAAATTMQGADALAAAERDLEAADALDVTAGIALAAGAGEPHAREPSPRWPARSATGSNVADLSTRVVAEGVVRLAAADALAERSDELNAEAIESG